MQTLRAELSRARRSESAAAAELATAEAEGVRRNSKPLTCEEQAEGKISFTEGVAGGGG